MVSGGRSMLLRMTLAITLSGLILSGLIGQADLRAETGEELARQVQPILARRCFQCHGPTADEAGLRLNTRDMATAKLESGETAIIPGDVDSSEILHRITSTDESIRMPPEGKPLSTKEIATIRDWIKQGAPWADHWSFRPVEKPAVPDVSDQSLIQNPIDAFVVSRLEAANLKPNGTADRVALLRRAYYDLTGLPPTPAQIDAFLSDQSSDAFEKVIDELLDSEHYGEKWARHWLDLVRYAETNGYERDSRKELIWKYRDYLIGAFNEDKPYDRLVLEQLAGDELPDRDADSITATGFYRLGIWDDEPADRALARYDYLDDILRTTGESFLAMTIGCARCHDHKIEPISQRDYYSMLAFFSDISPHGKGRANHVEITTDRDRAEFEAKLRRKSERDAQLDKQITEIESAFLKELVKRHPEVELGNTTRKSPKADLASDSIKSGQEWKYTFRKPDVRWFEIAFDDSKWKTGEGGFGRQGTPGARVRTDWHTPEIWMRRYFGLTEIPSKVTLRIHHDEDAVVYVNGQEIASFKGYIGDYKEVDVTRAVLDRLQTGRNTLAVHCRQTGGGQYIDVGLVGDFNGTPITTLARKFGKEILGQKQLDKWLQMRGELTRSQAEKIELETDFAMAVSEAGRRQTWILGRGNPSMQGEEVSPAFPSALKPDPASFAKPEGRSSSGKRLALARWIANADNPATARVAVNRMWQHHFGRGLVRSTSDFGVQGAAPTHPELLDWLASRFVEDGWSLKKLHKLMMMSRTYQMSSAGNDEALLDDPQNNLFWRFNMRRLTAEEIRDSVLAAGGTLNLKMFGQSVFPPLSPEVLATSSTPHSVWGRSSPEEATRRSIYIHVKRSLRPPMLANFDAPDTDSSCSARMSTTVPTQALGMLNSRFMNEQASRLAERLSRERPDSTADQVQLAMRLITSRKADRKEIDADVQFISELQTEEKLTRQQAMQNYCLLLLNSNEFVYLD